MKTHALLQHRSLRLAPSRRAHSSYHAVANYLQNLAIHGQIKINPKSICLAYVTQGAVLNAVVIKSTAIYNYLHKKFTSPLNGMSNCDVRKANQDN